ncbi:dehydrogenase E1 component subunit alpha/beta [Weeksellaceae bacterium KMM 9713]|uniref:Dehydrogenase E1 component subunit alpha/beta n=1 Tax=Profundicola chukchiensis TaxID=2961959 RepID=A0A9X4RVJ7_9FLAO|nr:dehydrogenase E1 component subunit alpha/beta [Profundicola chukchiensis]MDG4945840.1 dehydrogenase E1 component subunit alpha/beta [Profundicola chukchiensis]
MNLQKYTPEQLQGFYKKLLLPRVIEERMLISLRQGKISKWFSSWGQEGISVGCTLAMNPEEYMLTMHRNLGVFTSRDIPLRRLFSQFQGKENGFTKGRDRSFHFGTHDYKIVGMISHLGSQMGVADGIALANKLKKNKQACLVFTGDGGASEGDFHESINVAAVWQLPVIFIVENNQWGLSTPSSQQFRMKSFADKGIGYGIEAVSIDGNDFMEVYETVSQWAEEIRENPRPVLIECNSFRMRGHEEASGTAYYPEGLIESWEEKDPLPRFEAQLLENNIIDQEFIEATKAEFEKLVMDELAIADAEPKVVPNREKELADMYAPFENEVHQPKIVEDRELRFVDAIAEAIQIAMDEHPKLVLMGQDIADYGGVFKITDGLLAKYGEDRVRNTPLCEAAIVGSALGLSISGYKAMVEMQFSDFVTEGFNQIVNNLAKSHYRWQQNSDVVVRMPTGAGVAAGPYHSQSTEAWFTHTPGLKVVYPSTPEDAKGLLLQAFADPNPVMFFEHKKLYRTLKSNVPEGYYTLPFGKARFHKKGEDLTIVTYGLGVHWALDLLAENPEIKADLIDLRTLVPWDKEAVIESVKKTGKVLVLHEDVEIGGFGGEISAVISEVCFEYLDAPVMRVASMNTAVPFDAELEKQFLPTKELEEKLLRLWKY